MIQGGIQIKKKFFACVLFLIMTMGLGLLTGCQNGIALEEEEQSTETPQTETNTEIDLAIEYGLVPEYLQTDYEKQITYAEFCDILDALITVVDDECLVMWEEVSSGYRDSDEPMSRMEGAIVFLYAAECMGMDAAGYEYNIPLEDYYTGEEDFYAGVTWEYPLLTGIEDTYYNETLANSENYFWRVQEDYAHSAVRFVEYFSYGTGATYFDYDESYSLDLGDAFTVKAAVCSVERLYETCKFYTYESAEGQKASMTAQTLEKGNSMEPVSASALPQWKGYTVPNRTFLSGVAGMKYSSGEVEQIAELGFNFVRVPIQFDQVFQDETMQYVNVGFLETLDELIASCAEYGIHVCIDLHDMPGFMTDEDDSNDTLFSDAEQQRLFADFWHFMASYYEEAPSNLLSFNLLNEPHGGEEELTDELYSQVMLQAIDVIQEVSPDRLIFVDMLNVGFSDPVYGLVDAGVVQTIHPYFLEDGAEIYPQYTINGFVHKDNGELEISGNFPEGTQISFEIETVHLECHLQLIADGTVVSEYLLGGDTVGENGCINAGELGTGGDWFSYENAVWNTTLTEAAESLVIHLEGDSCWYQLNAVSVETPDYSVTITASNRIVTEETVPRITVSPDGTVDSQEAGTLVKLDRDSLNELLEKYQTFTSETGVSVMVQEFGFNSGIPVSVALEASDDFLNALTEHEIPWCSWYGDFGILLDARDVEFTRLNGYEMLRDDYTYEEQGEHWLLNTKLWEIYAPYMK